MDVREPLLFTRRAMLPLALASVLGTTDPIASHAAVATTYTVANCEDKGAGTLRDALVGAPSGSIVDVSQLRCSTISLDNGGIAFSQNDMTIIGPGREALTIKPGLSTGTGLLLHKGTGTLSITGIAFHDGQLYSASTGAVHGGCLYSHGNIALTDVELSGCLAISAGPSLNVGGGCAYANGDISVESSLLHYCQVFTHNGGDASGGCVLARGDVTVSGSTFDHCHAQDFAGAILTNHHASIDHSVFTTNSAKKTGGIYATYGLDCAYSSITGNGGGVGGGVTTFAQTTLDSCLISDNFGTRGSGMYVGGRFGGTLNIVNSTISGNFGAVRGPGVASGLPTTISNSTITDNRGLNDDIAAVHMEAAVNLTLQSSIVARNGQYGLSVDIDGVAGSSISGANNIVTDSPLALPFGTITSDPLLGPLRDNGGLTRTHTLRRGSPAINAGNNSAPRMFDQRGSPHRRVMGTRQDIGAFEADPDQVFADRFE
jgi:hypothetical protein